jgi:hypothetical protein
MKIIKLDDQFTTQVKTASYLLIKTGEPKRVIDTDTLEEKTVIPKEVWYYISMKQVIGNYAEKVLAQSEDLKDLLKRLKELEVIIKNIK